MEPRLQDDVTPNVQSSAKRRAPGFVKFVPAVAYYSYLALPSAFTQPGARLLAESCSYGIWSEGHQKVHAGDIWAELVPN